MRVFALVSDAFGGHGGIAVYNRDLLSAFTMHQESEGVLALPRVISRPMEPLPNGLDYRTEAAGGALSFLFSTLKNFPRIIRSDIIYCGHVNLAPLAWLLGKITRRQVLCALYGIEAWSPPPRRLAAWATCRMDRYFSISTFTTDRFQTWSGIDRANVELLPNAIHLKDYAPGPKPVALAERLGIGDRRVLLTLGRLVSKGRAKGFDEVLQVLPGLLQQFPDLVYVIAGNGPYRDALEAKVDALGLQGRVVFTGYVEENEKSDLYRLADLYVMPSRGEGFGFVFLEAMACGIPVIASQVDGSRDAVRDGALGLMVHPDDPDGLRDAIIKGLELPRGTVPEGLSFFSFPQFAERSNAILDRMVAA